MNINTHVLLYNNKMIVKQSQNYHSDKSQALKSFASTKDTNQAWKWFYMTKNPEIKKYCKSDVWL